MRERVKEQNHQRIGWSMVRGCITVYSTIKLRVPTTPQPVSLLNNTDRCFQLANKNHAGIRKIVETCYPVTLSLKFIPDNR